MWTFSKQKTFMNLGKYGRNSKDFFSGKKEKIFANSLGTFNFGARKGFGRYLTKGNIRNGAVGAISGFVLSKVF